MNNITINIHGSCVSRDSFESLTSDVTIVKYISRNSIFSVICEPLDLKKDEYKATKPYLNRMIAVDFKKELFSYLSCNPTDYLVLDLIDERFKLLKFVSDKQMIITNSSNFVESDILSNHHTYSKMDYYLIDTANFSDGLIKKGIDEYAGRLLNIYRKEQIIINETYLAGHYISNDGKCLKFKDTQIQEYRKLNQKLKKLYEYLIAALDIESNHIIKMPKTCLACEASKWGLAPFHFTDEYYQNVAERFMEIVKEDSAKC